MAAIDMPDSPAVGDLDTATNGITYICTGINPTIWTAVGSQSNAGGGGSASVSVGTNPPTTKVEGDLWFNTNKGILYVWYVDADQLVEGEGQWVDTRPGND